MSSRSLIYPDISEALYNASSIDEARELYIKQLRDTGTFYNSQYANKLEHAKNMLSESNLDQLEEILRSYKKHMRTWSRTTGVKPDILRRQKDFLGLNSKIRLYLQSGKALSRINDLLGFRVILLTPTPDCGDTIKLCYEALNETIRYFTIEKNCLPIDPGPRSGKVISEAEAKKLKLFIPPKPLILKGFEDTVKDYVFEPKKRGYQSLHVIFESPKRVIFEIQIRTAAMDMISEYGSASHNLHKQTKYENVDLGTIDYSRIHMDGFKLLPDGTIYDRIGLQHSIDPFDTLY